MKRPVLLALFTLTASFGMAHADEHGSEDQVSADIAAGEEAYQAVCRNCHGPNAQGVASYPALNDKEVDYLVDRLERYREGEKIGPNSMLMIPHAKELSDDDIVNIAAYITEDLGVSDQ